MRAPLLVVALAGCGTEPPPIDSEVNCSTVTDDDDFVIGLNKMGDGGVLSFTIMAGDPAPPIRGDNSWVIRVDAAGGAPVSGASISVTPFMPAHGHSSGKAVVVTPDAAAGQYRLSPVNLWMPGVWETTVNVTSGSGNDQVVFKFCISS